MMQPDITQPNNYRIDEAKYKSLLKYIRLEKPHDFAPFGHAGLSPLSTI